MNRTKGIAHHMVAASTVAFLVMAGSSLANKGAGQTLPTVLLKSQQMQVLPGTTVQIDAFITNVQDIGSYQLYLNAQTSDNKRLVLSSMKINKAHKTFLFGSEQVIEAIDKKGERLAVITYGMGVSVPGDEQRYLATFTFKVPKDAQGSLHVTVDTGQETMLLRASGEQMTYGVGDGVTIQVVDDSKIRNIKRGRSTR